MLAAIPDPGLTASTFAPAAAAGAHRWFEARAAREPDAVALAWEGGTWSYAELDRRAASIAAALRRRGVDVEARVGVLLDRSPELVAALLGVLKAGAAFLPLDPGYPPERLAYMVRDCGVRLALTTAAAAPTLVGTGAEPLSVEEIGDDPCDADEPSADAAPDALAYVIYTSGSTGRPKGVGVPHHGLCNTALALAGIFDLRTLDRVLQFASPSFDAFVAEVFITLLAGAELHLAPREALLPGPGLLRLLADRGITQVILPPPALALLPEAPLPALRTLMAAGEACPAELVRRWAPGRRFVNAYGPTEAAVCATAAVCRSDGGVPPIGAAIAGARVYLLDASLSPASEGEVYVGGAGVARGYLGRPGLTAERFLPDPFSPAPGARMYRTGDRARPREEGALEFVGRLDAQVKVRGHRVEPGEVAAALTAHPALAHAAVAARADAAGAMRLVAYVVPKDGVGVPHAGELLAFLGRTLPEYMLPAAFVALDALPLTPNGKVDHRALPAPPAERPALSTAYVAPRSGAERQVTTVWGEVLGIDGVGAEDTFLELGGHSLAATQVVSRLRQALGVDVPLAALLGASTAASFARAVEAVCADRDAPEFPPVLSVARGGDLPPSFSQERVWFLAQLAPENLSYHAHAALRFRGALDVAALEAALTGVVERHEVLRTTYPTVDGRPVQRIHAPWEVRLPVVDLSGVPEGGREAAIQAWMREDFTRRFDLSRLPLLRWTLLKTAEDEHRLVQVEHHIIHDGWSFNVLLRDLLELYRARVGGREAALPALEVQFADFCAWQREWIHSGAARAQLEFWRRTLAGSPPLLELPTDRPRPAMPRFRGAAPRFHLPAALYRRLRALAGAEGATLFMAMLAAFDVLLARWSGQEDVVVGTGIAGRRQREVEGMAGMFVNSLVLRTDLSGDPTFRELLARVRETTLAAYARQDVPFEAVVDAVRPGRTLAHNPLFQVMFSFHDSAQPELALPGLEVEAAVALSNHSAKFDLNVVAIPHAEQRERRAGGTAEGITLVWEYDADLFDAATVERMFRHYRALLEAAAENPDEPVSRLAMLSPAEAEAQLAAGRAARRFPVRERLHRRFEAGAARQPHAVAVTCGGSSLTYAELDARANRLAHRLIALGVGPETRVALCLERSLDLVVAVVGVLKAGGAYVPVDPAYPAERIAFVLEDAGVPVLVTQEAILASLPAHGAAIICLDRDAEDIGRESGASPEVDASPDSLAYVIYTSGSTGKPKGVLVTHANVVRLFDATDAWFGFGADDVWTLFHSCAFDFSVWELWGALLYGGRLVVVPFPTTRSPEDFHRLLLEEGVTVLSQTPSAFRSLIQADLAAGISPEALRLRWVVFGGEALDPHSLASWFERHGDERPRMVNMYGITETTVHVTLRVVTRADLERQGSPIGVPIPDLSLYLLDRHLRPVTAGAPGELFVGGAGVARGYLNRPELTVQRFVRDPFSADPGARLYRSGDLARRRSDGELEYLGRADQQVKVRGFRIEPGEIEAALTAHPAVAHAAVVVREDAPGERRLVAYLVPRDGAPALSAAELRPFLAASLPDHMVPAAFVALEALPLTAHGKLDRAALPAPGAAETGTAYAAPRDPVEAALAEVWSEVLGAGRVGIDDNYFALGGDSIRTVQVVARARERGVPITLPQLFQLQTIRLLAAAVGGKGADTAAQTAPETLAPFALVPDEVRRRLPRGVEDAYPLAQLQLGMLYHSELEPESSRYHNVNSYRLETAWDEAVLRDAARTLSRRHPVLRTSFDLASYPEPLQLVHADAEVPLAVDDLRHLPPEAQEAEIDAWMRGEMDRRFDWSRPPLVRFHVHRLAEDAFRFSVTEHHAILDGWSVATLLTELFRRYAALRGGVADPTGEAPRSGYRDFVALERTALAAEATRGFWARTLDGAETSCLPRAADAPRAAQRGRGSHAAELSAGATAGLRRLAERAGVPLKSVLLAAHLRVLALLGGRRQVLTGLVANGRPEAADGERILGLFLNTVPLVARVEEGSWTELARAAFAAERELLPHRRFPLAQAQRLAGRAPLVDVAFNYIHFHVYHDLLSTGGIAFQGAKFFQETEFSLVANFYTDLHTGRVRFRLDYDPEAIGAEDAAALSARYERVLAAMVANADAPHAATGLLADEERARLLGWGTGPEAEAAAPTLAALFDRQAERTPDSVALVAGGERLTFAELRHRAERLAHRLRARAVGPGTVVGVCTGRSLDLAVGLLGTLKSGGVYLPLDPAYPSERLAYMLADSGAGGVVTTAVLAARFPSGPAIILLDAPEPEAESAGPPPRGPSPEDAAYLIYTSGSTGTPKGVVAGHREAARHCAAAAEAFGLTSADVVLQFASASFDVSLEQLLAPLAVGARVVLRGEAVPTPVELAALVRDEGLTVVNPPTAYWQQLVRDEATCAALRSVRLVIAGGDVMHPAAVRAWEQTPGPARLLNAYGPTEALITAAAFEVPAGFRGARVPVGRPLPGRRLYVVGETGELLPPGAPGELCIAGPLLARGYHGRPGETEERFVADHFAQEPGARMYHSGDLARWRADGTLEFLGRLDAQAKVRGFRVEPGEVEAALLTHPEVREAAAAVRAAAAGEKALVAWAVPRAGAPLDPVSLRAFLAASLPAHLVPAAIGVVEALPLTPGGKVDRAALPTPGPQTDAAGYVAPRTPAEEVLAGVWAEVLGTPWVGVHDDFLALGGHSLAATRLVARVRELFRVELPLRALFDAPSVAALAGRIEAAKATAAAALPPIPRAPDGAELPLSFAQERLWFVDRVDPGLPFYNLGTAVRLSGELDVSALRRALTVLVERHEALRTLLAIRGGSPRQVIVPAYELPLSVDDLGGFPEHLREEEAHREAAEELRRPYDLERGPLFRARLRRLAPREHVLVLAMHHAVADGWSLGILFRELGALYAGGLRGEPAGLAPLPVRYADHAAWQRAVLESGALDADLAWWKERLEGAPAALDLPTDRPRPPVQGFRGGLHAFTVPPALAGALRALSRESGATLFMTLLAAYDVLLSRWSGQEEVVVGTPVAGRTREETAGVVGMFVNFLPLRADLSGRPTFRELLARVRDHALEAYARQAVPFDRVVGELKLPRDPARPPVFQAVLALQNAHADEVRLEGLESRPLPPARRHALFDLTLTLREEGDGGIEGTWDYAADLFDPATVERLAEGLAALLRGAAADPDRPVADLPLLGEASRAALEGWERGPAPAGKTRPVHAMVAGQARLAPGAVALRFGDDALTRAELDLRVDTLARALRRRGVRRGSLVAVCLERGLDLPVAVLAVHRAGGAYLPLDPAYPADRLAYMLADSDAALLLTHSALAGALPGGAAGRMLIDAAFGEDDGEAGSPEGGAGPDDPAYLIYTSGSTGRPKGVRVDQHSLTHTLAENREALGIGPGDTACVLASSSFDIWLFEALLPLAVGAAARLVAYERLLEADRLAADLRGATVLHAVPALMRQVVDEVRRSGRPLEGMRRVFVGGDAVPPDLLAGMRATFPHADLSVLYGPTEATIICARHAVTGTGCERRMLGRPLAGVRLHLLDAAGHRVPPGVAGELYVGGPGVTLGYHGRPGLTAGRYLPDPFAGVPGARLYHTGDRARWLADGSLEFLGRADQQVKIRGFRVEPGEVEAVLAEHPGVREAAVLVVDGPGGEPALRACVAAATETPDPAGLCAFLRGRVPEHMVPAEVVVLESLPLTPAGKVDRRALAALTPARPSAEPAAARSAVEEAVAGVWSELLARERVGVHDSFFELGGHSILLVRMASRVQETFRTAFPLRRLLETPTVAGLSVLLVEAEPRPGMAEKIATVYNRVRRMSGDDVRGALRGSPSTREQ